MCYNSKGIQINLKKEGFWNSKKKISSNYSSVDEWWAWSPDSVTCGQGYKPGIVLTYPQGLIKV